MSTILVFAMIALSFLSASSNTRDLTSTPPAASSAVQQHETRPEDTIRVRVRLIPVDVAVTSNDGKPILDLRKEDFTLLEDGRPQEIQHFSIQGPTSSTTPAAPQYNYPVLRRVPTLELVPRSARTFFILLGRGKHLTRSIDDLIRFVRSELLPQDRAAVFAYNRATEFTTDHEKLAQVLERYDKSFGRIEGWCERNFRGTAAIYGQKEIPKAWQIEIDKIFQSIGEPVSRSLPAVSMNEAERQMAREAQEVADDLLKNEGTQMSGRGVAEGRFVRSGPSSGNQSAHLSDLRFDEFASTFAMTSQDVHNMYTAIEYMRFIEGEKHLLFFTEKGIFLPRLEYDKSLVAAANDARVSIDTFQTGGVAVGKTVFDASEYTRADPETNVQAMGSPSSIYLGTTRDDSGLSFSRTFALASLRNVSELTGGRSSIHSDIGKALSQVNDATRSEYLLGYYPDATGWDGRYRRITVKVNRAGLRLSYRHGYYARETVRPYDRAEFIAYSRISAAAAYEKPVEHIPFKASAKRLSERGSEQQIRVDVRIDASKVRFQRVDNIHRGKLQIAVFYSGADGAYLGNDWHTLDMGLQDETYRKILGEGIPYATLVPFYAQGQTLKVVVYDCGGDQIGSKFLRLP